MTSSEEKRQAKVIAQALKTGFAPGNCPMVQKSKKGKCSKCRKIKDCDKQFTQTNAIARLNHLAQARKKFATEPDTTSPDPTPTPADADGAKTESILNAPPEVAGDVEAVEPAPEVVVEGEEEAVSVVDATPTPAEASITAPAERVISPFSIFKR